MGFGKLALKCPNKSSSDGCRNSGRAKLYRLDGHYQCNLHKLEANESLYQAAGGAFSASEGNGTEDLSLG